jgi:hypothetical protein
VFKFYNEACNVVVPGTPTVAGIGTGTNNIHLAFRDACGGEIVSTAVYVVVTYTPASGPEPERRHTNLEATPTVAEVLPSHGFPVVPHLLTLSAKLTGESWPTSDLLIGDGHDHEGHGPEMSPLAGKQVVFTNHGDFICKDVTDNHGMASCFGLDKTLEALVDYRATFVGDGDYFGSSDDVGLITLGDVSIP